MSMAHAITSCFYVYVRPIPLEGEVELPREGFGYISRQAAPREPTNYRECVFYDADDREEFFAGDGMWRAGKAMSLLACGIGGIVMCIIMCTCCVAFQLPTFDGLFWTCMFCFVAQSLTFLSWGSDLCNDYECTWSGGTSMNITAAMLWVWAANMIKSFPEALPPRGRGRRKRPVYDDNDDPYTPGGFEDEYDEDDEDQWDNDGDYYDDYDDDYDDGYYDGDDQYYDNDEDEEYPTEDQFEPDGYLGAKQKDEPSSQDPYATDYQDPEPNRKYEQGRDDEFEPNAHFEDSWRGDNIDDESRFSSTESSNAFHQPKDKLSNSQADLSNEELNFLDGNQKQKDDYHSSFGNID